MTDLSKLAAGLSAVHFVGFRGDEYLSAVRVFGKPGFIHMGNDPRMLANGCEARPSERNFPDTTERLPA